MRASGRKRQLAGEQGSVTLLVIGCTAILFLLVAVVVDASAVFLARRTLVGHADGAALAAAQQVSEAAVYASGVPGAGPVPLDGTLVRSAAAEHLAARPVDRGPIRDVHLVYAGLVGDGDVVVVLAGQARLPLVNAVTAGRVSVPVTAEAQARLVGALP
jgi:hypothetical protein